MQQKTLYTLIALLFVQLAVGQVGIGTAVPVSNLQVAGAVAMNVRTVATNYSAGISDQVVLFNGTTASSITLPDASVCTGRIYWIKNSSATIPTPVVMLVTVSSQTINAQTSWLLDEPNEVVRLTSDGSNWQVFSQNTPIRKTSLAGGAWLQGGNKLKTMKSVGTIENHGFSLMTNNAPELHINTSGFIGLNTTSPEGKLHSITENDENANDYYFQDFGTTTQFIYLRKARGTLAAIADLQTGDNIAQIRFAGRNNDLLDRASGSGIDAHYTGTGTNINTDLRIFGNNKERMRINPSGYIGIGTSTFDGTNAERLLVDAGETSSYNVISGKGEIDNYLQLNIKNSSSGNVASSDIVATADNGSESGNYIDMGINSSGYTSTLIPILDGVNEAYLYALGGDMKIGNGAAYDLGFFTNGFTLANERMRITVGGNIGIGTTTPADKLSVAGILSPSADNTHSLGRNGARWLEIWAANGVIQTSDLRLKTNVQPLQYGRNDLMKLQPVHYKWANNHHDKVGLIAQQVKAVIPEVVTGDEATETLGMNYSELIPVLINTLKEQQQQLAELNARLKILNKQYR